MARATAVTRGSAGKLSSSTTSSRSLFMKRGLSRELDERQRLRGSQVDWAARLGAEGFAVEDQVRAFALDRDLVRFLEVNSAHGSPAELSEDPREHSADHRVRLGLDCQKLESALAMRAEVRRQQQFLERRHRKHRKPSANPVTL